MKTVTIGDATLYCGTMGVIASSSLDSYREQLKSRIAHERTRQDYLVGEIKALFTAAFEEIRPMMDLMNKYIRYTVNFTRIILNKEFSMEGILRAGRAMLISAAVLAAGMAGCGGDDDNQSGGGGGSWVVNKCGKDGTADSCGTIEIGGMTWMAQNLNWRTPSSMCYDGINGTDCDKYGRLYSYDAAVAACPAGWHLATVDEWDALGEAVGGEKEFTIYDSGYGMAHSGDEYHTWKNASPKLRARSMWPFCSTCSEDTDEYGFAALPAGSGSVETSNSSKIDTIGWWWASGNGRDNSTAWTFRIFGYHLGYADVTEKNLCGMNNTTKTARLSVRCVKD